MTGEFYSQEKLDAMREDIRSIAVDANGSNWVGEVDYDYDEDFKALHPLTVGLDGGFSASQLRQIADIMECKDKLKMLEVRDSQGNLIHQRKPEGMLAAETLQHFVDGIKSGCRLALPHANAMNWSTAKDGSIRLHIDAVLLPPEKS